MCVHTIHICISEKNLKKYTFICVHLNHFAVHLKLIQHCKSAKLQLKKKKLSLVSKEPLHFNCDKEFQRPGSKRIGFCNTDKEEYLVTCVLISTFELDLGKNRDSHF